MKRRDFLSQLGMVSALAVTPKTLLALDNLSQTPFELFKRALANNPSLIGYQSYNHERVVDELVIEGTIPKSFNGSLFRNGPALFDRALTRYEHMFEGDGMIHAFNFKDGQVDYRNKFVQTEKFKNEQAAQRFLYDFSQIGIKNPWPITSADSINSANTNILPVGDELWALWEAGSAHAINAESLETKGVVTLNDSLKGMPFSAHPKVDADGTIWNFGLDYQSGKVILYRLNAQGKVLKTGMVDSGYHAMLHDFLVTKNHILLILPSLKFDPNAKSFMQGQKFNKDQAMRVLVVDKNDFSLKASHEFSACFMFHFGNAWEDADGSIHFDACRYPDIDIMDTIVDVMKGKRTKDQHSYSLTTLFSILPRGKTNQQTFDGISEFPRIYPSMTGLKNNKVFTVSGQPSQEWMHAVRSVNLDSGKIDEYNYGDEFLVEEHIVVENGSKALADGWLVGTALHWPSKKSCVSIFQAENIAAGPVARAWLPFHIPLGFHGNFKKA